MFNIVRKYMESNRMIKSGDRVVVGVSGGADSVCLLNVLVTMQKYIDFSVVAVHINHGIRGKEALRDENFTRSLCESLGVPFKVYRYKVAELARDTGMSVEETGRMIRYEVFWKEAGENGLIAVAHHMDDQCETILMNLARGSAIKGLCGMQPVRDNIIRPLLCVRKCDIEKYLSEINREYVDDSTNFDNDYMRNKVRNVILPYIEKEINASAASNICSASLAIQEAESYISKQANIQYDRCVKREKDTFIIDLSGFMECESIIKKYIVRKVIGSLAGKLKDIYRTHIEAVVDLCDKQVGSKASLAYGIEAQRGYNDIRLYKSLEEAQELTTRELELSNIGINESVRVDIDENVYIIDEFRHIESVTFELLNKNEIDSIINQKNLIGNDYTKLFDYDKMGSIIHIRHRQQGDIMVINQAGGVKKIKDYFIDKKIPSQYRDNVLLIADDEQILWAAGFRMSEKYKITQNTKHILKITIK